MVGYTIEVTLKDGFVVACFGVERSEGRPSMLRRQEVMMKGRF
jgi:hypothetical protein